jgi:hypothetical protein
MVSAIFCVTKGNEVHLERKRPSFRWNLAGLFMDASVIVVAGEIIQDLLDLLSVPNVLFFTEVRQPLRKVIKDLFNLPFCLGLSFPCIASPGWLWAVECD